MKNKASHTPAWFRRIKDGSPFVIAGPCSAETEGQVMDSARQLQALGIKVMRAGLWKPRTRPGNFEGVGATGLKWLQKAKMETGLLMATEVASAVHVEKALKNDIDLLWIGARTTVSPFNVQEIAEALKGTEKIVLLKNPINPDLGLWLGAIERFYKQNITKLGVIHRGFSSANKSVYRNIPEWQIPIDLKTQLPNIPLLLDPSHIAGNRQLIFALSQTALNLNYDGFMIETHPHPARAWSDARQQITPARLKEILHHLKIPQKISEDTEFQQTLSALRENLNHLDQQLFDTLVQRMKTADEIGRLKVNHNVSILQNERWQKLLQQMQTRGTAQGLSATFMTTLFKAIHQESINHQKNFLKTDNV